VTGPRRPRLGPEGRASTDRYEGLDGTQVEGRRAVLALLRSRRRRARDVWIAEGLEPAPVLAEIRRRAEEARVPIRSVTKDRLAGAARTDAPQGVLAHAEPVPTVADDDLYAHPRAFLVALDGVTDPRNLGAILRSAEAAGGTGVLLPKHRSAHLTPAAVKAAAGAVETLPIALVPGIPAALERAARAGVWAVGLDDRATTDVYDLDLADQRVILVVGAEGAGLSRLVGKRCDLMVRIPMAGQVESLNVAAAATLALFEVARRRRASSTTAD
jgi:23S rRNA (guanosine2251-2'-O)-methyltransferase